MAEITFIDKTPAVAEKVTGATVKFTAEELTYLQTALEVAYKAHLTASTSYYVAPVAVRLHKTVKAARAGEYKPPVTLKDVLGSGPYMTTNTI